MANGVLSDVSLGYQLLWGPRRSLAGVQLWVDPHTSTSIDTRHLLSLLGELWPANAVPLQLGSSSASLLAELLDTAPVKLARIEVTDVQLQEPTLAQRVVRAAQRGLSLVWRGEPGAACKAAFVSSFDHSILNLSTEQALLCLRIAKRSAGHSAPADPASPVLAGQTVEGVASCLLVNHVLDQQGAGALLGWPAEDVLHACRQSHIHVDRGVLTRLLKAIETDASMEDIERGLAREPLLAYRFLRYANSAGVGLCRDIDSLRQALMLLGLSRVKAWVQEQMPHASVDPNLQPIRIAMVLRARLMADMLDAGEGDALTRELYLCGLLSQLDLLLGEPLDIVLGSLPLPERVNAALIHQQGPYWPFLAIASALACPNTAATHALCLEQAINEEDVNLSLLRTLAAAIQPGN